jgi:hypothetical protein
LVEKGLVWTTSPASWILMITQARVLGAEDGGGVIATLMPECCSARNRQPSHKMVKETLLRCLPFGLRMDRVGRRLPCVLMTRWRREWVCPPVRCISAVALLYFGSKVHCLQATMLQAYVRWTTYGSARDEPWGWWFLPDGCVLRMVGYCLSPVPVRQ